MSANIKIVYVTKVMCRNYFVDAWNNIKNFFGGRLKGYEKAIDMAADEALKELYTKYPGVKYVRLEFGIVAPAAYAVMAYGECIIENTVKAEDIIFEK